MSKEQLEQVEALQVASPYCGKIIKAIRRIVKEYSGGRLPDTDEYMEHIRSGLAWIISVYNGTRTLVNADQTVIDEAAVNKYVVKLNDMEHVESDDEKAEIFEGILHFVEDFKREADSIVAMAA